MVRKFFEEVVLPDAVKCEENGKRISQDVVDKLWYVHCVASYTLFSHSNIVKTTYPQCESVLEST